MLTSSRTLDPLRSSALLALLLTAAYGCGDARPPEDEAGGAAKACASDPADTEALAPSFTLSCSPTPASLPRDSTGTITCTVKPRGGFRGLVDLSAGRMPPGVTIASLARAVPIRTACAVDVSVAVYVTAAVEPGTYGIEVVGSSKGAASATFSGRLSVLENTHRLHVLYLVPSDRAEIATPAIERTVRHLQIWYRNQMGNGATFTFGLAPVPPSERADLAAAPTPAAVWVIHTPHTADWYSTHPAGPDRWLWFWNNVTAEAHDLAGAGFYQPNDTWVIYIDAAPAPDQIAGGTSGIALLPDRDIKSIMGLDPEWTVCRGYGGSGHEIGHAFFLPHPPTPWTIELMATGYLVYPGAILTDDDRSTLNRRGFFSAASSTSRLFDCSSLYSY